METIDKENSLIFTGTEWEIYYILLISYLFVGIREEKRCLLLKFLLVRFRFRCVPLCTKMSLFLILCLVCLEKLVQIEKIKKMKRKQKYFISYGYFGSCVCKVYFAGFDFGRKGYMWRTLIN